VTAKEGATPVEPADRIDSYIEAAAEMLALPVEPAWKPAVKANLLVNLRLAAVVAEFPLPDEAEPAPVFGAER
jgi:1-carboxybiuret hydrolase subunit AtzG-like protein